MENILSIYFPAKNHCMISKVYWNMPIITSFAISYIYLNKLPFDDNPNLDQMKVKNKELRCKWKKVHPKFVHHHSLYYEIKYETNDLHIVLILNRIQYWYFCAAPLYRKGHIASVSLSCIILMWSEVSLETH